MSEQPPQLFEWDLPPKKRRSSPERDEAIPRPDGWHLVGNKRGPQGFHLLRASPDRYGTVYTECGIVGRIIHEESRKIVPCKDCQG